MRPSCRVTVSANLGYWHPSMMFRDISSLTDSHPVTHYSTEMDESNQENLESGSICNCVQSTRFRMLHPLPSKRSVHGSASKYSPKVLCSVSLSKLVLIPSTWSSIPSKSGACRTSQMSKNYSATVARASIRFEPTVDTRSVSKRFCGTSCYSRCLYSPTS